MKWDFMKEIEGFWRLEWNQKMLFSTKVGQKFKLIYFVIYY